MAEKALLQQNPPPAYQGLHETHLATFSQFILVYTGFFSLNFYAQFLNNFGFKIDV